MQLPNCYIGKEIAESVTRWARSRSRELTNWVGGLPSSLIMSVFRTTLPSTESLVIKSLALALLVATPKLTMLSILERLGLAPSSSYELGRARRVDPSTSLWKRPRGKRGRS